MRELTVDSTSFAEVLAQLNTETGSAACEPVTLYMAPGLYEGGFEISRPYVTLHGSEQGETILTGSLAANEILEDGIRRGTFRTHSVFVNADYFTAVNLTFSNTAGPGELADQALALYSDGDHLTYDHCRFLGNQDTLFTAPLPPKEIQPGGFRGPKQFAPRRSGRQLFTNCYIEGTIDFIFGGGACVFDHCEIYSLLRPEDGVCYTTAASTPEEQRYGYVFHECKFTGNAKAQSVYLGRPWRDFAHVAMLHCYLGEQIHPDHWDDWGKKNAHSTVKFYEYKSYGPGAVAHLPEFARFLTDEEALAYDIDTVLSTEV